MNIKDLLADPVKLYIDKSNKAYSLQLNDEVLYFLDKNIKENSSTLETGAGVSTVLFALKGARHICITPNKAEADGIKEYCSQHRISTDKVTFLVGRSENILPQTDPGKLDLVLIDGCHAFPAPFIDWYYTAPNIKPGGMCIIDNTEISTVGFLHKFLLYEPEWKLVKKFIQTSCFIKVSEGSHLKCWDKQRYIAVNSWTKWFRWRYRIYYYSKLLREKGFTGFVKKIIKINR